MTSERKSYGRKSFSYDILFFNFIALPVFFFSWVLGFFNLTYTISADIKTDYSGDMTAQIFYIAEGINSEYTEQYSERAVLILQKDKYSRLSIKLKHPEMPLLRLRLDLGEKAEGQITVKNLSVGGQKIINIGDSNKFIYNDLSLVSATDGEVTEFKATGTDPFISSQNAILSESERLAVLNSARLKVLTSVFVSLIIAGILFSLIRFTPSMRRTFCINWV